MDNIITGMSAVQTLDSYVHMLQGIVLNQHSEFMFLINVISYSREIDSVSDYNKIPAVCYFGWLCMLYLQVQTLIMLDQAKEIKSNSLNCPSFCKNAETYQ